MKSVRSWLLLAVALLALAGVATAQTTNGTISGHVADAQGLALPGVTVNASSPNLQGVRSVVTTENGDYVIPLLPSGVYTIAFELSGFERVTKEVTLAPTQNLPLNALLGPAALTETVNVVGRTADVLVQTTTIATNFKQDLIATLPTNRDINAVLLQAPGVHATGPSGNYSISGSMSFESLFLVNGVTVNENLRGQAENLYIEDAIQETTVASGGISAEYGRFTGGVVNVVTKSGGNLFTGSFRDTLNNDNWRNLVEKQPGDSFTNDSQIDLVIPTYEYTVGGPIVKDRLWFFHAGRAQSQQSTLQLVITNVPYIFTNESKRFEEKLTYSVNSNHRFQGAFSNIIANQLNNTFNTSQSMDLNSLEDRKLPEKLFTINYSGVLSPTLTFEARYSERHLAFQGSGAKSTDLINGTLLVDNAGRRYWSATFCGVCAAETRDNNDVFMKGTYFYSRKGRGSHNMVFGFDTFNDKRFADSHQSGSDYRILNAPEIVRGTDLFPQFVNGVSQIRWQPIFISSQGTTFRTNSVFYNDNWQISPRLSASIGLRWDKNSGANGNGESIAKDTAFSPRFGAVWDPTGKGQWSVTGSVAKYVDGLLNSIADSTSPAGNNDTYTFRYTGPTINPDVNAPNLVPTAAALTQLFNWFNSNGGANLPLDGTPTVRGVSPQILGSLDPPKVWEYAAGVGRQLGSRASVRADFSYRKWSDFYIAVTDLTTGRAPDTRSFAPAAVRGRQYDLTYITNDESGILRRQYSGLTLSGTYRITGRTDIGGNYTLSRLWGNVDGETPNNGPISDGRFQYPEYVRPSWNTPEGDLSNDQRHRGRLWINYGVPMVPGSLTVSLLQAIESGVPYSASNQNGANANGVNSPAFLTNPGYLTPPSAASITYFYTARDAFRTEGQRRTDLAVSYNYGVGGGSRKIDLFIQGQMINMFNQAQLCGCGATVFANGGNVQNQRIDTSVRTAVSNPTLFQTFNPFTTTPVQGANWDYGTNFGRALSRFAYTSPREYRLTFGVRF